LSRNPGPMLEPAREALVAQKALSWPSRWAKISIGSRGCWNAIAPIITLERYNRFMPNLTRTDGKALLEAGRTGEPFPVVEK
jgi:hypothetical protein